MLMIAKTHPETPVEDDAPFSVGRLLQRVLAANDCDTTSFLIVPFDARLLPFQNIVLPKDRSFGVVSFDFDAYGAALPPTVIAKIAADLLAQTERQLCRFVHDAYVTHREMLSSILIVETDPNAALAEIQQHIGWNLLQYLTRISVYFRGRVIPLIATRVDGAQFTDVGILVWRSIRTRYLQARSPIDFG